MNKNSKHVGHSIYHDLMIKAPIARVFKAISEPDQLINWWPQKCSGAVKLNAEYNFFFTEAYNWFGTVDTLDLNRSFFIKMTSADEDWNPTTFGFELEKVNDAVLVKFSHVGWPQCNEHFRRSSFCWAMLLNGLKEYIENGIIVPFEERS